jgi:hypothetical protein
MKAVAMGCVIASVVSPTAITSSITLSRMLLNGSGEVFAAARVVALAPCEVSATEPATSAATACIASGWPEKMPQPSPAAAAGRTSVWMASQTLST